MADNNSEESQLPLHKAQLEIAAKIQNGDECAFRDLFKSYYQPLVNLTYRYVRDVRAAEDIVEDIFLSIWQNRKNWNPTLSVKAYLYQTARNRSLNYLKRDDAFSTVNVEFVEEQELVRSPEQIVTEQEFVREIQNAIEQLPDRTRTVFTLAKYDNLKYSEIATVLNVGVGTVETHMVRALKALRKQLAHMLSILV